MEQHINSYWDLWQIENYGDILEKQADYQANGETGDLAKEHHPDLIANDNSGRSRNYCPETLNSLIQ